MRMRRFSPRLAARSALVFILAAGTLGAPTLGAGPASAAEPDPTMNDAVFNRPTGAATQQNAIFIQLARIIDRVPAGGEIQMSWFGFGVTDVTDSETTPDLPGRLLNAHQRGVRVKIILDHEQVSQRPYQRLLPVLGSNDTAGSYIVHCADKFPSADRGCIGTRRIDYTDSSVTAYNHNKFLIASSIVLNNGSTVSNVVFQGSANLGWWDANEAYNNGLTFSDATTYQAYRQYFADLRSYRYDSAGNNNYYWGTPTGTTYRAYFFPRRERSGQPVGDPATDTIVSVLDSVASCSYDDDGTRRQTDIRVNMFSFNRPEVARKLTALRNAGCWVDVVYSEANAGVLNALGSNVQLTRCNYNVGPGRDIRTHNKYMIIDGAYDDDIVPRVFTGSHNYNVSALRQADEAMLRVMGRGIHDDYLGDFWHVRDTCRANGGAIR
ncbi:phospholipase D-like domain-containing protein [Plantactinospora sp. CA-294935]|uniref:phospholipase D-like domain-containing protein n=1 Tax=Plantactinospora sp. CA-294935 TaxID=3240012 RepID=UPI003D8B8CCA